MTIKKLTLAAAFCALAFLSTQAQDPRCKIESKYDRLRDWTEVLCTIQTAGKLDLIIVATHKGKKVTERPLYTLVFTYFDNEAFPNEPLKYDKAEGLFILADEHRRQIPLIDYRTTTSETSLRGRVIHIEGWKAALDRETLAFIVGAKRTGLRIAETEIVLTDDALSRLRDFVAQLEK